MMSELNRGGVPDNVYLYPLDKPYIVDIMYKIYRTYRINQNRG